MIERYSRKELTRIWTLENKFSKWLDIEIAACEAHVKLGNIPKKALDIIKKKASFSVKRIDDIEKTTNHDVIAFLTNVAEEVGPESRYIHLGLTSSDVVDTAFSLLIKEAASVLQKDIEELLVVLKKKANEYKKTMMMGRTHGVHAEPTTLGLKFALWYTEMQRNQSRLESAIHDISVGKISGAVGTYANIDPFIEQYVCKKLGLAADKISTQIVQRDRHAYFMSVLAVIAGSLEKFTTEIRALQKTEFNELEEGFRKGQKGSSAMPHKRNPITCERISGLARVMRGNMLVSMENICLWHERDISHSSAERIIFPDSTILLDYMLVKFTDILEELVVHEDNMLRNLDLLGGAVFSQQLLLKLVEKGSSREEAYALVQKAAMETRDKGLKFQAVIGKSKEINKLLAEKEIKQIFDYRYHLKNVDDIFKKVFG
ncbi:MAG: adenylosuccinate lyase [Candidatus Margulisbacteria bacterium]|nr:adenylosuccinate lyase [Candidatus Margulisiibacteriota bacterium]